MRCGLKRTYGDVFPAKLRPAFVFACINPPYFLACKRVNGIFGINDEHKSVVTDRNKFKLRSHIFRIFKLLL